MKTVLFLKTEKMELSGRLRNRFWITPVFYFFAITLFMVFSIRKRGNKIIQVGDDELPSHLAKQKEGRIYLTPSVYRFLCTHDYRFAKKYGGHVTDDKTKYDSLGLFLASQLAILPNTIYRHFNYELVEEAEDALHNLEKISPDFSYKPKIQKLKGRNHGETIFNVANLYQQFLRDLPEKQLIRDWRKNEPFISDHFNIENHITEVSWLFGMNPVLELFGGVLTKLKTDDVDIRAYVDKFEPRFYENLLLNQVFESKGLKLGPQAIPLDLIDHFQSYSCNDSINPYGFKIIRGAVDFPLLKKRDLNQLVLNEACHYIYKTAKNTTHEWIQKNRNIRPKIMNRYKACRRIKNWLSKFYEDLPQAPYIDKNNDIFNNMVKINIFYSKLVKELEGRVKPL